jgi:hypothetical protein
VWEKRMGGDGRGCEGMGRGSFPSVCLRKIPGIGRAVSAVASYLVCAKNWSPETTQYFVGAKRPISFFDKEGLYLAKLKYDTSFGKI